MATAHCPHCLLVLPDVAHLPYPPQPMRCPFCRLVIGRERARAAIAGTEHGARAHGSAAGVLANAMRSCGGEIADEAEIAASLRTVARERGCPLDRLRMLDYQVASEENPELVPLASVIATLGSWKLARTAALLRATRFADVRARG